MVFAQVMVLTRDESLRGSHGLSAQRARRTKSRGPKGLQLEVGARRAPQTSSHLIILTNIVLLASQFPKPILCRLVRYARLVGVMLIECPPPVSRQCCLGQKLPRMDGRTLRLPAATLLYYPKVQKIKNIKKNI